MDLDQFKHQIAPGCTFGAPFAKGWLSHRSRDVLAVGGNVMDSQSDLLWGIRKALDANGISALDVYVKLAGTDVVFSRGRQQAHATVSVARQCATAAADADDLLNRLRAAGARITSN